MRFMVLVLVLVACGCVADGADDYCEMVTDEHIEDGYAEAEDGYGELEGYLFPGCRDMRPVEVRLVTGDDFPDQCTRRLNPGESVLGCAAREKTTGLYVVWVRECLSDPVGVLAHERLHTLLRCDTGDADTDHTHDAWGKAAPL